MEKYREEERKKNVVKEMDLRWHSARVHQHSSETITPEICDP